MSDRRNAPATPPSSPSWFLGGRDGDYALAFMNDLRSRLANRVQ
jgi:hypothetical protein